jgi:hypothetical protein
VLATYDCDEGTRQLVAQRINGKVALRDVPSGDEGKVYLIERHVPSKADILRSRRWSAQRSPRRVRRRLRCRR